MIRITLFSGIAEELRCIRRTLSAYSIQHSWADCQVDMISDLADLENIKHQVDILVADVSNSRAVAALKAQKAKYPPMLVFPVAGPEVPPTSYVCPEIMPCGLFWRPISQSSVQPVVEQMMACVHDQLIPPSQNSFRISGKQKIQDIPYSSILYFEAREKKLALRMQEQEMVFPGTLSQLEQTLPGDFIRCHKSFLINRRHVLSVDRTNSSIVLDNRMEIPLSRSYKKAVLEVFADGS